MSARCFACGGPVSPSKHVLKAAFGLELPEDEESTAEPFSDATDFDPKGYAYARGGRVKDESEEEKKRRLTADRAAFLRRQSPSTADPERVQAALARLHGGKKPADIEPDGDYYAHGGIASLSDPDDGEPEKKRGAVQVRAAHRMAHGGKLSFAQHMARRYGMRSSR